MNPDSTKKRLTPTYPMEEALRSKPSLVKIFIAKAWKNTTCSAAKNRSEVNSGKRGLAVSIFTDEGPRNGRLLLGVYPLRSPAPINSEVLISAFGSKTGSRFQPLEVGMPASTHARHPPSIDSTFV